ncbi:GNAT family N-acetyltransferase [Guggenheimella bovis]
MDIKIRKALPSDAKDLLELGKICGSETDNLSYGSEGFGLTLEQEEKFLEKLSQSEKQLLILAFVDGEIAGSANYSSSNLKRFSHRGTIGMAVQKKYWNHGIASLFLKELIDFAKNKAKAKILSLGVRSDNERAIHLYKKFGFKKIGTFEGYFEINGELIDVDYMNLRL